MKENYLQSFDFQQNSDCYIPFSIRDYNEIANLKNINALICDLFL